MGQYIIGFFGGTKPDTPEEAQGHLEKFMTWTGSLGRAVVNQGTPLKDSKILTSDGQVSDDVPWTGYTIIQANNYEEAMEFAKGCPHLDIGGTLRIAEIKLLNK